MDAKGASGSWILAVVATPRSFGSCNDRPGLRRSPLRASAQPLGLLSPNCLRSGLSVDSPLPRWSDGLRARAKVTPKWHKHGLVVPQRDLMRAPVGVGRFPCLPLQQHRPWKDQHWACWPRRKRHSGESEEGHRLNAQYRHREKAEENLGKCGGKPSPRFSAIRALLTFANSPPNVPETQGFPGLFWLEI